MTPTATTTPTADRLPTTARALGTDPALGTEADGIWERIGRLEGRNQVAAAFYDGPGWVKFRPWERLFLLFQGGVRRARRPILRHLDGLPRDARVLEVGIGDGENLRFLPASWTVFGADLARRPLLDCVQRFPVTHDRLAWAEAENLPFADATFDACYSVGGFNYYADHARSLSEMARVTRPGGALVVADELPHIYRYGIGRLIPARSIRYWAHKLGVEPDFIDMMLDYTDDPEAAIVQNWPGATRRAIWSRLGYCYAAVQMEHFPGTRPLSPGGVPDGGPRVHA